MKKRHMGRKDVLNAKEIRRQRNKKTPVPFSIIAERKGVTRQAVYQFAKRYKIK